MSLSFVQEVADARRDWPTRVVRRGIDLRGRRTENYTVVSCDVRRKRSAFLRRITVNPAIFGGKPIIREMRISVDLILSLLAQGVTWEELLDDYPDLEREDIQACLAYAHAVVANESLDAVEVDAAGCRTPRR